MPRFVGAAPLRLGAAFVLSAAALTCASCGPAGKKVVPVQGKVLYNGQPLKGAFVFFHPVGDNPFTRGDQPRGVVGDDGSFRITTYQADDGAPPGKYTVTIFWQPKAPAGDDGGNPPFVRYLSPATSPLRAEVKETPTVLQPFDLTLDAPP